MDPIERNEKKINDYEKKVIRKLNANKIKRQKESFNNVIIWIVLISVIFLTLLFFLSVNE